MEGLAISNGKGNFKMCPLCRLKPKSLTESTVRQLEAPFSMTGLWLSIVSGKMAFMLLALDERS